MVYYQKAFGSFFSGKNYYYAGGKLYCYANYSHNKKLKRCTVLGAYYERDGISRNYIEYTVDVGGRVYEHVKPHKATVYTPEELTF